MIIVHFSYQCLRRVIQLNYAQHLIELSVHLGCNISDETRQRVGERTARRIYLERKRWTEEIKNKKKTHTNKNRCFTYSRANRSVLIRITMNQAHENNAVKPTEQSRRGRAKRQNARNDSVTGKERRKKRATSRSGTIGFVYLNAKDARARAQEVHSDPFRVY